MTSATNTHDIPDFEPDAELEGVLVLLGNLTGIGDNCAAELVTETFAIRDYCWCEGSVHPETVADPEDPTWSRAIEAAGGTGTGCPPNFEHFASGVRGVWYKHLGRDMRFSRAPRRGEALEILRDCLRGLAALDSTSAAEYKHLITAAEPAQVRGWGWSKQH